MANLLTAVRRHAGIVGLQIAFVIVLVGAWQITAQLGWINAEVLGTPSKVWFQFATWISDGTLISSVAITLLVTFVGYAGALVIGVIAGAILGTVSWLGSIFRPFVSFWQGFPRLIFYPFFAVALGFSIGSRMIFVAFTVVFVIIVSTAAGVADIDSDVMNHARILGATRWQIVKDVRLPAAVVWVGTSARVTFGFAIQSAMIAEFIGASSGLGFLIVQGQLRYDVNSIWAATTAAVIVAVIVDILLSRLQRYLSRWRPAQV